MEEKNLFTPPTNETPKIKVKGFETQNVPSWCKPIAKVYEESDYDRFVTYESNRQPDHVEAIKNNIKSGCFIKNPLICCVDKYNSERVIILDGNNRFYAFKALNLPIPYLLIRDGNEEDMLILNMVMKAWKTIDFVKFYARKGCQDYQTLLDCLDEYKGITFKAMVSILTGTNSSDILSRNLKDNGTRKVYSGTSSVIKGGLVIKNLDKAKRVLSFLIRIKGVETDNKVWNITNFDIAVSRLFECENFDPERMFTQYSKYRKSVSLCTSVNEYIKMMQGIYNTNSRKQKEYFDGALR